MANFSSDDLKKLLENYQQGNQIPEVSESEFQDTKDKLEAIKQPFTQEVDNTSDINPIEKIKPQQPFVQSQQVAPIEQKQTLNQDDELNKALDYSHRLDFLNGLNKAAMMAGHAISQVPLRKETLDAFASDTSKPIEDLKFKRQQQNALMDLSIKKQQADPNSSVSKQARSLAKSFGLDIPEDASYNAIKPLMEDAQKYQQFKENVEMRKEIGKLRASELQMSRNARQDASDEKAFAEMTKRLEAAKDSTRTGFGRAYNTIQNIKSVKALLSGKQSLDDIDPREMQEIARGLDKVISGATPTISGTEKLTPETARSKAAKLLEFVTSRRQSGGYGDFVKQYQKTLNNEERVANEQLLETKKHLLSGYTHLQKRDPERFQQTLLNLGIPTDILDNEKEQKQAEQKQALLEQFNAIKQPQNTSSDMVRIKDPNGIVRLIPKDKETAALSAGGTRVD